jgi:glyoxylase-like metal-dependent hydrolase (beta-lactamase superfamily II)
MSSRLVTIDCDYLGPEIAASYLRIEGDECMFVEANTARAVPRLLAALAAAGMRPEQVRWVVITHVHLDHAAGASALLAACPNARLVAHPRAAKHVKAPEKLVASAKHVYGEERFAQIYGTIDPIDPARVDEVGDGATRPLGKATLHFLHTRGHANHHLVVHDPAYGTVFTGDAFGLVYPRLQRAKRFAFPSTSPTDFDGMAAVESVERILALGTRSVCLTHFGELTDAHEIGGQLGRWLGISEGLVLEARENGLDARAAEKTIRAVLDEELERAAKAAGLVLDAGDRALLELDLALNAQGLAHAATKEAR